VIRLNAHILDRFEVLSLRSFPSVVGGEGCCDAPGESAWVVGEAGVQAGALGSGVHAVLRAPQGRKEGVAETKD